MPFDFMTKAALPNTYRYIRFVLWKPLSAKCTVVSRPWPNSNFGMTPHWPHSILGICQFRCVQIQRLRRIIACQNKNYLRNRINSVPRLPFGQYSGKFKFRINCMIFCRYIYQRVYENITFTYSDTRVIDGSNTWILSKYWTRLFLWFTREKYICSFHNSSTP